VLAGHRFIAKQAGWAHGLVEAVSRLPPRAGLAALYGYTLCRETGCEPIVGYAAAAAIAAMLDGVSVEGLLARLPGHARSHVERALSEAEDAHVRSPSSIYAQVGLDADALSRMAALGVMHASAPRAGLQGVLQVLANAMSWAAASDYVLYTAAARQLASRTLRPHTLALAKWVGEELGALGFEAAPRTETGSWGIVSYLDLRRCPCGAASKEVAVKPLAACIEYRLVYDCCGERLGVKICTPESTRVK